MVDSILASGKDSPPLAETGGGMPRADPTHQLAYPTGGFELARHLIPSRQESGDDRLTAPATLQADFSPASLLHRFGVLSLQSEPALHRVDRFLQDG
jgi:hypothetical protein